MYIHLFYSHQRHFLVKRKGIFININIYIYIYIYTERERVKKMRGWTTSGVKKIKNLIKTFWSLVRSGQPRNRSVGMNWSFICLFPPTIYTSLYSYVLSTVLRKSKLLFIYIHTYIHT